MLAAMEDAWDTTSTGVTTIAAVLVPCAVLLGCAVLHYVGRSAALRAAGGVKTPWRETLLSQLAAAAANRVIPTGLAGGTLNVRYLVRRGGVSGARAVTAVAVLHVLGAVAAALAFALIVGLGTWTGTSTTSPWSVLAHMGSSVARFGSGHVILTVGIAAGTVALGLVLLRRRRARATGTTASVNARQIARELLSVARRPRDLAFLMLASAGTSVVLAAGLAATAIAVAGADGAPPVLALLIAYMVGSAVGNAVPVPSGIGTTDAALVATVSAAGLPLHQALVTVLVFRIVTFWAPAVLGLPAAAALRRAGAY